MDNGFNDLFKSSVTQQFNAPPPIGLYITIIGNFLLIILAVVLLINLNIFLILKIKRMRKENREG